MPRLLLAALFLGLIVTANILTSHYGLITALVPGLLVPAGTYAAGLTLGIRDALHDRYGLRGVLALIAAGALLSTLLADWRIAFASGIAFLLAELLDLAVYSRLRDRGWTVAVIASNTVGAIADTALFLTLSGIGLTWAAFTGQVLVKAVWMTAAFLAAAQLARRVRARRLVTT